MANLLTDPILNGTVNFVLQLTENVAVGVGWVVGIGIWVIRHRTVSHSTAPRHILQCHTAHHMAQTV